MMNATTTGERDATGGDRGSLPAEGGKPKGAALYALTSRGAKTAFLTIERERAGINLESIGAELEECMRIADALPDFVFEAARERRRAELLAERTSPSGALVSSVELVEGPAGVHDRVRIWNRGALCGELVVSNGDGIQLRERLTLAPPVRELRAVGELVDGLAHDLEAWREELVGLEVGARLDGDTLQKLEDLISSVCDASCRTFVEADRLERGAA